MSENYSSASNSTAVSVIDVMRGVGRRKFVILAIGALSFAAALGIVSILKPSYSTQSQVLIENLETPFDRVQAADTPNSGGGAVDDRMVASQMAVLKSDDLGRRVVAALKLDTRPDFNPLIKGLGTVSKLKIRFGFSDDPALKTPEERALDQYNNQLTVYQEPESNVINIKYTAGDPQITAAISNTLAEVYVMATRESQSKPTERAREWLQQQITDLRGKLADSERAVEEFRSQAGLLQSTTSTLNTQQISDLNTQITVAQTASAEAKARADSIRQLLASKGSVDSSSEVLNSAVIQRLKEQRTAAVQQVAQLNAIYLPNHPKLIAAQRALADINSQMKSEALKIVAGLDEQARVAQAREKSLRDSLEQLKSRESASNLDDVKLKSLERDAAANRALLETMLARYAEASARQDANSLPGLARIIQTAVVPAAPSFPKRGPLVVLATLAGLVLGFGIVFLLEIMRAAATLTGRMEAAAAGAAAPPVIAAVPPGPEAAPAAPAAAVALQPPPAPRAFAPAVVAPSHVAAHPAPAAFEPRVAVKPAVAVDPSGAALPATGGARLAPPLATFPASQPSDRETRLEEAEYAEAATTLASWVAECQRDLGARRIGIASMGGSGNDSALATVATVRALAATGKRVVLIDAARHHSAVESLCGLQPGAGLVDLVSGAADFTRVFARDSRSTAHIIRYGADRSDGASAALAARIDQVITALMPLYELIVIDCGDARGAGVNLLAKCDASVLLAPVFHLAEAAEAAQALDSHGMKAARYALVA